MAIPTFDEDVNIIAGLGDRPTVDDGLTPTQFKQKFDQASVLLKAYINGTLIPKLMEKVSGTGILKVTNGVVSKAVSGTDYQAPLTAGTDYATPSAVNTAVGSVNDALTSHAQSTTIHVTSTEKTTWNGKQDELDANQKRHIFVQSTEPTGAVEGDIWLKVSG